MLSVVLIFSCSFSAGAYYDRKKTGEVIELSDDGLYLLIENCTDFPDLSEYEDINEIFVVNSVISDPDFMKDTNITTASFNDCRFNFEYVYWPENLDYVSIFECELKSLDIFKNIKARYCEIFNLEVEDLSFFGDSASVECLRLGGKIGSLEGVQNVNSIYSLEIDEGTWVTDISPVGEIEDLETFIVDGSFLDDISPLKNTKVSTLEIFYPFGLQDVEVFKELKYLEDLNLIDTEVVMSQELYDIVSEYASTENYDEAFENKKQVEKIVSEIIPEGATDMEKVEIIANYVVENMEYDYEAVANETSGFYNEERLKYALTGKGICDNYTALVTAMLHCEGIDTYEYIAAEHIWNLIYLDGEFYWLDTTWMDSEDGNYDMSWFMVPLEDEEFLISHEVYSTEGLLDDLLAIKKNEDKKEAEVVEASTQPQAENPPAEEKTDNTVIYIYIAVAAGGAIIIAGAVTVIIISKKKKSRNNIVNF